MKTATGAIMGVRVPHVSGINDLKCPDCGTTNPVIVYLGGFNGYFAQDHIYQNCGCYYRLEGENGKIKVLKRIEHKFWFFEWTEWKRVKAKP